MKKSYNHCAYALLIILVLGSFFGKCNDRTTFDSDPSPIPASKVSQAPEIAPLLSPAYAIKMYSLRLYANAGYTLKAYTDAELNIPVANLNKIDSGATIYISIPKSNIDNKTVSIAGADNFYTILNVATVKMDSNRTITATYALDTENFTHTPTFETITGYIGNYKNIEIPAALHKVTVTTIAAPANTEKTGFPTTIKSIIVPNSVMKIENNTFANCNDLSSITLPNTLIHIGDNAFFYCSALNNITLPNTLTTIGDNAFFYCSALTKMIIPNSVTNIGVCAFSNCKALTNITLPDKIISIQRGTFLNCSSLTNITFPDNITNIESSAFSGCRALKNVTLPNILTNIEDSAFSDCQSFTNIILPSTIAIINPVAFYNCDNLTTVRIEAPNPPAIQNGNAIFGSTNPAITALTIITPIGKKVDYKNAGWTAAGLGRKSITIIEE